MNYAITTYHQGNIIQQSTQRNVMQTTCGIFGMDTPSQRPKRNPKRQSEKRTQRASANDVLRNVFLPKMVEIREVNINEREFYNSLSKLANHYGFSLMHTQNNPYPYNIHLAYEDAEKKIKQKEEYFSELKILQHPEKGTYLSVSEVYPTYTTLYHIPIKPLYRMLNFKDIKPLADLFLSVYSYYFQVACIPYYRDDDYVSYLYEMMKEWVMDNQYTEEEQEERQEQQEQISMLQQTEYIGDIMGKKLKNKKNLDFFKYRLDHFNPKNDYERECKELAEGVYNLYKQYPNEIYFRNSTYQPQECEEYESITMNKYIGFVATADDWLSGEIEILLNTEFNECTEIEEPTIFKDFTKDFKPDTRNFDFEKRLFESISKLYALITKY